MARIAGESHICRTLHVSSCRRVETGSGGAGAVSLCKSHDVDMPPSVLGPLWGAA